MFNPRRIGLLAFIFFTPLLSWGSVKPTRVVNRHQKLEKVLEHFNAKDYRPHFETLKIWDKTLGYKTFETLLEFIDPHHYLDRYASWTTNTLTIFKERDLKQTPDLSLDFSPNGKTRDPLRLTEVFRKAKKNPTIQPLLGLRIALDPGHMGGKFWDQHTGKFVSVGGHYVSEGTIALQTCLLLKNKLEQLGAEVLMTRYHEAPATELDLNHFNLEDYAKEELRQSSDYNWFDQLLNATEQRLISTFRSSSQIQMILSKNPANNLRSHYFIHRADLITRADMMNAFQPHLTLIIHFDASKSTLVQNSTQSTRAYIPGNILPSMAELSSPEQRAGALRTILNANRWIQSKIFSSEIVSSISKHTKIKIKNDPTDIGAIKISDGVYARNLALNRLTTEGVMTFLEVLNYDYYPDYLKLATKDKHISLLVPTKSGGQESIHLDYSSRLDDIVDGITEGILNYVSN